MRHFSHRQLPSLALLLAAGTLLTGCLERVPASGPGPATPAIATVPLAFFSATPYPLTPTAAPFLARYTLGKVETPGANDPRVSYAAPLAGRDTKFVQVALQISGLAEPRTPAVAYELATENGVFAALASGEWEAATPDGATYRQDGVLLFVVPRDLRAGRLEIIDYSYPPAQPGASPTLQRRVLAAFDLPRLP